jgi:hypothetical protein
LRGYAEAISDWFGQPAQLRFLPLEDGHPSLLSRFIFVFPLKTTRETHSVETPQPLLSIEKSALRHPLLA